MEKGKLFLYGSTGNNVGTGMLGGEIIISGRVGDYLGYFMNNGRIDVYGNAGGNVGYQMSGGTIVVDGTVEGIFSNLGCSGCKIEVRGNVCYENGRWVEPLPEECKK